MTALLDAFNKEKALVGAFSEYCESYCEIVDTFSGFLAWIDMDRFQNGGSREWDLTPISTYSKYWDLIGKLCADVDLRRPAATEVTYYVKISSPTAGG